MREAVVMPAILQAPVDLRRTLMHNSCRMAIAVLITQTLRLFALLYSRHALRTRAIDCNLCNHVRVIVYSAYRFIFASYQQDLHVHDNGGANWQSSIMTSGRKSDSGARAFRERKSENVGDIFSRAKKYLGQRYRLAFGIIRLCT